MKSVISATLSEDVQTLWQVRAVEGPTAFNHGIIGSTLTATMGMPAAIASRNAIPNPGVFTLGRSIGRDVALGVLE